MGTIFIGFPAYNEEDVVQTVRTALGKAANPSDIHIGIGMQYPSGDFPDLSMFPNVKTIHVIDPDPLGISPTRDLAVSLYDGQDYFLQIDAHTIFSSMWDVKLQAHHKELSKITSKPMISQYLPDWHRNKETSEVFTMNMDKNFEAVHSGWTLVAKTQAPWRGAEESSFRYWTYGVEGIPSPYPIEADFSKANYQEQWLSSGHFNFTLGSFLEDVPYDPDLVYHDENVTPMRAWTRGYRIFCMKNPPLWTRELMTRGRDIPNSWRSVYTKVGQNGRTMEERLMDSLLKNKDILTGEITGIWGAPTKELLEEYEKASGINYQQFYKDMYKVAEEMGDAYPTAKKLMEMDRKRNG